MNALERLAVHQLAPQLYVTRRNGGRDVVIASGNGERVHVEAADLHGLISLLQRLERENLQTNGHAK
jgi:hypothetical protein